MSSNFVSEACQTMLQNLAEAMNKADRIDPDNGANDIVKKFVVEGLSNKKPNIFQMGNEYVINAMLSGTGTPVVNVIGNAVNTIAKPLVRLVGTSLLGDKAAKREARAMFDSILDGFKQDMVFLQNGVRAGIPVDFQLSPRALGMSQKEFNAKMEAAGFTVDPRTGMVSPEDSAEALRSGYDYMTKAIRGKTGEVIRFPTRLTIGIDEYFKARLRTQKTMALISRKASLDEAAGKGDYDTLYKQYKQRAFALEPTESIKARAKADFPAMKRSNPNLTIGQLERMYADQDKMDYASRLDKVFGQDQDFVTALYDVRNYATDGTFQTKLTGQMAKISEIRGEGNTLGSTIATQIVPFLRTPWNLTKEGFSYVPGAGILFKPGQTKTKVVYHVDKDGNKFPKFETDVIPMSKEELVGRQIVGLGVVTGLGAMYAAGNLTGSIPDDPAERATWQANGIQPFSIKVGDKWISYQRVEPFATVMGLAADTFKFTDRWMSGKIQKGKETEEAFAASWSLLKANVLEKTFLQGYADMLSALESDQKATAYLENLAKRTVPALANTLARAADPYEREAVGFGEKMQQRVPVLREQLPKSYALYSADPNRIDARMTNKAQAVTGVAIGDQPTPFQQAMAEMGVTFSPKSVKMSKVKMNSEQLSDYKYFINQMSTRMFANSINNLSKLPNDQVRQTVARKMMAQATKAARAKLMAKYPDLRKEITAQSLYDKYGIEE